MLFFCTQNSQKCFTFGRIKDLSDANLVSHRDSHNSAVSAWENTSLCALQPKSLKPENQRIKPQSRKENNSFSCGKKPECFPQGIVTENQPYLGIYFRQVEVGQNERLQADNQVLVRRKNIVVGELDFTVEVLAAAFGTELDDIMSHLMDFRRLVVMLVAEAMQATFSRFAETACKSVVFSAIMELYIPPHRNQ